MGNPRRTNQGKVNWRKVNYLGGITGTLVILTTYCAIVSAYPEYAVIPDPDYARYTMFWSMLLLGCWMLLMLRVKRGVRAL